MRFVCLISVALACSSNSGDCECPPDFTNATTTYGSVCVKKYTNSMVYEGRLKRRYCKKLRLIFSEAEISPIIAIIFASLRILIATRGKLFRAKS